jgi:hypothetical protein
MPCSSRTDRHSTDGATSSPRASTIHCCVICCAVAVMTSLPDTADLLGQQTLLRPAHSLGVLHLLPDIAKAASEQAAVGLFWRAVRTLGADAGVFISAIKEEAARLSIRSLLACDPRWAHQYSNADWHEHDPWLRHALGSQTPIRGEELHVRLDEREFIERSTTLGFASTIVVPAPTCFGGARYGVLVLGSNHAQCFANADYDMLRIVARALAMELHEWLLRALRENLLERSGITPDEIDLLRHEAAGHTSKMIAAAFGVKPRAVDYRFQCVCAKLNTPDRRTAMRIARLYGLI